MISIIKKTIATFFIRFLILTGLFFSVEFIVKFFIFIDYRISANLGIGNCLAMRIFTCFVYKLIFRIDLIVKFHVFE
ncbi:hypothetical protein CLV00_3257 [Flavobacterium sp. 11]|jgi:hypothetical protein|nr:hypothetical protein CLV00_3257 [Flavobacterium sp. 11]